MSSQLQPVLSAFLSSVLALKSPRTMRDSLQCHYLLCSIFLAPPFIASLALSNSMLVFAVANSDGIAYQGKYWFHAVLSLLFLGFG